MPDHRRLALKSIFASVPRGSLIAELQAKVLGPLARSENVEHQSVVADVESGPTRDDADVEQLVATDEALRGVLDELDAEEENDYNIELFKHAVLETHRLLEGGRVVALEE